MATRNPPDAPAARPELVIITGLSGSGKGSVLKALEDHGIAATLRREKGHDIDAACGQLRLRT